MVGHSGLPHGRRHIVRWYRYLHFARVFAERHECDTWGAGCGGNGLGRAIVLDELDEDANSTDFLIEGGDRPGVTLVAFAGLKRPSRKFEFFRLLSRYDVRCVFLSDHEQAWYQLGVRGIGDTSNSVAAFLRDVLGDDCSNAVFTGASAGGYAALLFGAALGVAEVHAFAPQTF